MKNYYLAQLKPFGEERHKPEVIQPFQQNCINKGICGMGWDLDYFNNDNKLNLKENDNKTPYLNAAKTKYGNSSFITRALNCYLEMSDGDYILTRLDNNRCYIGKVTSEAYHSNKKQAEIYKNYGCNFSWIVDVEWKFIGDGQTVIGCLRGEFGKRLNTIQRIHSEITRQIINILYEGDNNKKIELNEGNFNLSLDSNELEDLVACYVQDLNREDNLFFIPSTCKPSNKKYEFLMTDGTNNISLQIKNNEKFSAKPYLEDIEKGLYSKIYLFSGTEILDFDNKNKNVVNISKADLYNYLKNNVSERSYWGNKLNRLYDLK